MPEHLIMSKNGECHTILVDEEDLYLLTSFKWSVRKNGYLQASVKSDYGTSEKQPLHRLILAQSLKEHPNLIVDHINRNKLDNRKENLRLVTPKQSVWNRKKWSSNRYVGVYRTSNVKETSKKYQARIDGEHLGYFHTENEAALAYNKACFERRGNLGRLNKIEEPQ